MSEKHNHADGVKCEACEHGVDYVLEKEKKSMEKYGWFAHFVQGQEDVPYGVNIHTHGLSEIGHNDLQICAPISPEHAHTILTTVASEVKAGKKFESGKRYDGIISPAKAHEDKKYDVLFAESVENERPVLRLIFLCVDGTFEGDFSSKQLEGCILPEGTNLK